MSEIIQKAQGVILSPGDVHINSALTNFSLSYMQQATDFASTRLFPVIPVAKQSDTYWSFDPAQFRTNLMRKRAPATEAPIAGFTGSQEPYYAHVWALGHDIADQTRANADSAWNIDTMATQFLTQQALQNREAAFVENFLSPGVWTNERTGIPTGTPTATQFLQWSNPASTPIEDIRSGSRQIQRTTGLRPNKLAVGRTTFDYLVDHPDIVDRVKYGQTPNGAALVNMQALAALFEVDEVVVTSAVSNTDGVTGFVFDNGALLVHSPNTPGLLTATAGATFSWTGYYGANGYGGRIKKFRMEALNADRIEIQLAYDQRVTSPALGLFFNDAVAADA